MPYPDSLHTLFNDLSLYLPIPEGVRPAYERHLCADPQTPFPFWSKIWPAGYELAHFLREEPEWVEDKKLLELGAGIALPSFAVAHTASEILVSDHVDEAVQLMKKNIDRLQLAHAKARLIDWHHCPVELNADVLLLSDINYAGNQFEPLLLVIRRFLSQATTVILSTPLRINITPFAEALQPFIKRSELRRHRQASGTIDIGIWILSQQTC